MTDEKHAMFIWSQGKWIPTTQELVPSDAPEIPDGATHVFDETAFFKIVESKEVQAMTDEKGAVTLCRSCWCATYTINGRCGKCKEVKPPESMSKFMRDIMDRVLRRMRRDEDARRYFLSLLEEQEGWR